MSFKAAFEPPCNYCGGDHSVSDCWRLRPVIKVENMKTKTVDGKGRLMLGHQFAGQLVIISEETPDKIVIQLAKVIPASEALPESNQGCTWREHEKR